jgi:hypothetical protein
MRIPVLRGVIDRRILVNYRVNPDALQAVLPPPFHPKLHRGVGVAGICLIRLRDVRPAILPGWLGVSSENAAHRIAVEWCDETGRVCEGVYIPRRDTSSRLNAFAGGRLFPGVHHHARFAVRETPDHFELDLTSDDGRTRVTVKADLAAHLPASSVFRSLEEASKFFENGSLGYSATADPRKHQGLELRCHQWKVEPLAVAEVRSSFFEDESAFPRGTVEFDSALLMRGIVHEWRARADLCCSPDAEPVLRPRIANAQTVPAALTRHDRTPTLTSLLL